jgi:hypothetical protein
MHLAIHTQLFTCAFYHSWVKKNYINTFLRYFLKMKNAAFGKKQAWILKAGVPNKKSHAVSHGFL